MKHQVLTLAALMAAAVAAGAAQSQVNFGDDGVEPKSPQIQNPFGGDLYIMIIVPGTPLFADARDSAQMITTNTKFRDVYLAFKEDRSKQFVLIRSKTEPFVWGWVRRSDVLHDVLCKRSEDTNTSAFMKAALKNNLQVSVSEADTINLLAGPGAKYEIVEKGLLAQIMYVFDRKKDAKGDDYLLLGWDADWNPDRPTSIAGWVRKDQCTVWDSRIAVFYNRKNIKDRHPVRIYRTLDDLKADKEPLAVEARNSTSSLTYDRARFPVLQDGRVMKIAFIGDPSRNLKQSLADVNAKIETIRNMQVLFLIDGTISMGRYFRPVQQAVREYIESIPNEQEKARHHFAVAVYRDYEDGPDGEMEVIADFNDPRGLARLGTLKEHSSPEDHTLPEAMFNGIVRSVRKVSWDKGMLKVVVIIGDHPNHPVDPKGYTVTSVVKSLQAQMAGGLASGFRFNAINVNVTEKWRHLNQEFLDQVTQIANQFKPAGRIEQIPPTNDLDDFRASVIRVLRSVLDTSEKLGEEIKKLQTGQAVEEVAPVYGTELTSLALNLLKEVGVTPQIINQKGIRQISQEGWVSLTENNQKLMEAWIYIERKEMDEFRGFLASLLQSSDRRQRASQIITDAVRRTTGDDLTEHETVADFVKRAFGVPFRGDSMVLSKTPAQLQQALADQNFWSQFRKRIGYSWEVLGLVSEQRDPDSLLWDPGQSKWVRTNARAGDFRAWVTSAGGQTFCWIPLEYLP